MDIRLLNFISPKDLAKICRSQLFFKIFLVPDICDSRGSYSRQPDPVTGCRCKVRPPCSHPWTSIFFLTILLIIKAKNISSLYTYTHTLKGSVLFFSFQPNVVGKNCDQCQENTFFLDADNPYGCLRCFCMGVTKQCTSTSWNKAQVGWLYVFEFTGG